MRAEHARMYETSARAEIDRLRAALAPFAREAERTLGEYSGGGFATDVSYRVTFTLTDADLIRARDALR